MVDSTCSREKVHIYSQLGPRLAKFAASRFHWEKACARFWGTETSKLCTVQRKSDLSTPRKTAAQLQSQFPDSCICERFIYSHDRSTYFPAAEYVDRSWESLTKK